MNEEVTTKNSTHIYIYKYMYRYIYMYVYDTHVCIHVYRLGHPGFSLTLLDPTSFFASRVPGRTSSTCARSFASEVAFPVKTVVLAERGRYCCGLSSLSNAPREPGLRGR